MKGKLYMKRKKLATMLVVAFAISATSVAPVMGLKMKTLVNTTAITNLGWR